MKNSATAERFSTSFLTLPMTLSILLGFSTSPNISKAFASTGCSGQWITINSGKGGEPPSRVIGHRHITGNHYIKEVKVFRGYKKLVWWADNNGGVDGDTQDTYYGTSRACNPFDPIV